MHSKPKLALAMLTSPTAAFEDILKRRLLGTALVIAALAGILSAISPTIAGFSDNPLQFYMLGRSNPIVWMGLLLLYAAALWKLLRWVGTEIDYLSLLTVMGWAQASLALANLAVVIGNAAALGDSHSAGVVNVTGSLAMVLQIWYVVLVALGVRAATAAPLSRGIMTYMVIEFSAIVSLSYTYNNARFGAFATALTGIKKAASAVIMVDQSPWIAAAIVGFVLGLRLLGYALGWESRQRTKWIAVSGLAGIALLGGYIWAVQQPDYYGRVLRAQKLYNEGRYEQAAAQMRRLLPLADGNAELMIDIGNSYFQAGRDDQAISYFRKSVATVEDAERPDGDGLLAEAYNGLGMVHDFQGDGDRAIAEFKKATKLWPTMRDPWNRMAVTYDRMGRYREAIQAANHAMKELKSEATVGWVALAQAFVQAGDMTQGKAAIEMVVGKNEDLAQRIGLKAENWKDAVGKLTREDLAFPLEQELAPPPEKTKPAEEKAKPDSAKPRQKSEDAAKPTRTGK